MLRAVLLDGEEARDAFTAWRDAVDLADLDAASARLLPLLARRPSREIAADDPLRSIARDAYRATWLRNHVLWRRARPVVERLRAVGVRVLVLKGVALVGAYGDDWGSRPMFDVDLLVRPEHLASALDVLEELGWTPEYGMTFDWVRHRARTRRHAWGFLREDGRLDLHWHVLQEAIGTRSDDAFWANAVADDREGLGVLAPSPADLLLHVLEHGAAGDNPPKLQWIVDATHVVRAHGAIPLADSLARRARAYAELGTMHATLDVVGAVVDRELVAPLVARVAREHPTIVERLRHGNAATRELAARAAGTEGLLRASAELVRDRLDLGLAARPALAVAYAATGRPAALARAARRRDRAFARTPARGAPPVSGPTVLDFSRGETLDRYGGPGWGRPEPTGATTRGGEARIVLPLAGTLGATDLAVELELHARDRPATIDVRANEERVAAVAVGTAGTRVRVVIPRDLANRFVPMELAVSRVAPGPFRRGGPLRVRVASVQIAPRDRR